MMVSRITPAIMIRDVPPKERLPTLNRPDAMIGTIHTITRPVAPMKTM